MLNLILFGPPGSGKGTQALKLVKRFHLLHLSTGDLLRDEIRRETKLGVEAKHLIDAGKLVPDAVVIGMIKDKLEHHDAGIKGIIFDGFPRTVPQAEALDNLLEQKKMPIRKVLALKVNDEELVRRMLTRGVISGRSDDADETISRGRIVEYNNKTAPLANYYKSQNKFVEINGEGSIDSIFDLLSKEIEKTAVAVN
jgi:adenylate kinase